MKRTLHFKVAIEYEFDEKETELDEGSALDNLFGSIEADRQNGALTPEAEPHMSANWIIVERDDG